MPPMVELQAGDATVLVSPVSGGRVASIEVAGEELLVTGAPGDDPLLWGSYPMVPYAGRIREGLFTWGGREVRLPVNLGPHAIHGSGFVSAWQVRDQGRDHVELDVDLTWSLGGRAHQHLQLTPGALVCVLTVTAGSEAMPVTLGWHPWFRKPVADDLRFGAMYRQDEQGIPTGELIDPPPRPWDDCFVRPLGPLVLQVTPRVAVTVASDCDHWVVYDKPEHATCVEPQSGPPDAVNLGVATVLEPGEMVQRSMTIAWTTTG
ncbi:MAG: aldose epimerase [Actinobacteria bacterium]|nr:aldose epimerase [Actinomycetota bacterium]